MTKSETVLKPLGEKILVQPDPKPEEQKKGSLYVPSQSHEVPVTGVVVAVGSGRMTDWGILITPRLEVGDHVLYGKFSGMEIVYEGEKLLVMKESDIAVVIP